MKTNAEATTETATVAKKGAKTALRTTTASKKASPKKDAPKAKKSAKKAPAQKAVVAAKASAPATPKEPKKENAAPREGSKKQIVLDLLTRKDGATMAELAKATGWQNHSIRGFISGTLTKKMHLQVASVKNDAGERSYHIEQ
jgi:hypothetical protein